MAGLALGVVMTVAVPAAAEWQLRPFLGLTFGGSTTLLDLDQGVGDPNVAFGASALLLGELVGVEADFGRAPGFFQSGQQNLVLQSSATTLTGNIVVALPRRMAEYSLRPYFVGGGGLMRATIDDAFNVLPVARTLAAIDLGGGVTGFVTERIGVSWEIRRFRSIGGNAESQGLSIGGEQLSFWRANMALAIRY
jgi:hypothetical protein